MVADQEAPDPPVITSPSDGDQVNNPTPEISGTGEPGATVEVIIDGESVGTAPVDENGNWTFTPSEPLPDGDHTIEVIQTDPAGNPSDPTTIDITVDTEAPDPPVITSPSDGDQVNNPTPEISGTGEPGATVEVIIDGESVGTGPIDEDGNWTFTPSDPLPDGDHTIEVIQTDPAGNESPPASIDITVDTEAPPAPVITEPSDGDVITNPTPEISGTGEPGGTVEIIIDGESVGTAPIDEDGNWTFTPSDPLPDGEHTIEVIQTDPAGNESPPASIDVIIDATPPGPPTINQPEDGAAVNNPTPEISGTGEPGATVEVIIDGESVGTAPVDENGNWTFTPPDPLPDGDHTIDVIQTDPAGNESPPASIEITVDTEPPAAPTITGPSPGSTVGDTPTITGTGEPGAQVSVIIDGEEVGTTTVDENGNWSFTPSQPLPEGEHTVSATQTDPAGNTSPPSDEVPFTVDATAPDPPVVTSPQDGGSVDGDGPTVIGGTGEPGATVDVELDGRPIGSVQVGDDGTWSIEVPDLPCGEHTLTATQTDAHGNESQPTEVTFTVVCEDDPPGNGDGNGGPGDGGPGTGGPGHGGGHDLITAPPVAVGPGDHGAGVGDGGKLGTGSKDLAQTGAPVTLLLWAGLLAVGSGAFLLRRFRGNT
ncbi:Ig-like domain-containing protein [Saccharomonospora sp. CUA-673]|uniref:Ig-like domain-containing protein n=1 Tax=Saccharomonospora sp. CUA-673 TaxID=1904969 RepID=UPI00111525C8|nr:Ig-like domain-containing protein [Saccharomonospora sp. CUA-673]